MTDKVTFLKKDDGMELVAFLRELTERAERGEIHALAAVVGNAVIGEDDYRYETFAGGTEYAQHRIGLIGTLQVLSAEIVADQIEDGMADDE